jgi:hypothetical protein
MIEFVVIVESSADARTATKLAERVLVDKVEWLEREQLQYLFRWSGLEENTEHSCWKDIKHIIELEKKSGVRLPKFIGTRRYSKEPLKADAASSLKILNLVGYLQKTREIKALLFIRDLDNQAERREGIEQACSEHDRACLEHSNRQAKLAIIIGTAAQMREAWVLNGFIPSNQEETRILEDIKTELNFDPCEESHRLCSNSWEERDRLRNPKVVVEKLTGGRMEREQQCWEETSLEYLREKGVHTGLTAYIKEIEARLIPIIGSAE